MYTIVLTIVCDTQYLCDMNQSSKQEFDTLYENLSLELRRGTVILVVLSQLHHPQYGYALVEHLSEEGFLIEAGTLYPLLRRLESQQLLQSSWETTGAKPRKYYRITEIGSQMLDLLTDHWYDTTKSVVRLLKGGSSDGTESV